MIQTSTVQIIPEMFSLAAEIDEVKRGLANSGHRDAERLSALRLVSTIETIGTSTRIEGSRLSDHEVERLLSEPGNQLLRLARRAEIAGYADVMETVFVS